MKKILGVAVGACLAVGVAIYIANAGGSTTVTQPVQPTTSDPLRTSGLVSKTDAGISVEPGAGTLGVGGGGLNASIITAGSDAGIVINPGAGRLTVAGGGLNTDLVSGVSVINSASDAGIVINGGASGVEVLGASLKIQVVNGAAVLRNTCGPALAGRLAFSTLDGDRDGVMLCVCEAWAGGEVVSDGGLPWKWMCLAGPYCLIGDPCIFEEY